MKSGKTLYPGGEASGRTARWAGASLNPKRQRTGNF